MGFAMTSIRDQLLIIAVVGVVAGVLIAGGFVISWLAPSNEQIESSAAQDPLSPSAEPNQPPRSRPIGRRDLLQYADQTRTLGRQIAGILENVRTPQDAERAVIALEPLGVRYRKLNGSFQRYYLQDGGPAFNKLKNHPLDVQRAVMEFLRDMHRLENDTLYELAGRNLPRQTKDALTDASGFTFSFTFLNSDGPSTRDWLERLNAPYIAPDPNTLPDPNKPADPNAL